MTQRAAGDLDERHIGKTITVTGQLVGLIPRPGSKAFDLTIRVPHDQAVELHPDT